MKIKTGDKLVQGDVILRKIDKLPNSVKKLNSENKILQMSEVTGHHHHFRPEAEVELYTSTEKPIKDVSFTTITDDEGKYIVVNTDTELFHGKDFEYEPARKGTGDHNSFLVPAGVYQISIVREYDYDRMEETRVVD